jgi:hypothetical protein
MDIQVEIRHNQADRECMGQEEETHGFLGLGFWDISQEVDVAAKRRVQSRL